MKNFIILFAIGFLLNFYSIYAVEFKNFNGDTLIYDNHPELQNRGIRKNQELIKIEIDKVHTLYINTSFGNLICKRRDFHKFNNHIPIIVEFTYNSGTASSYRYGSQWQSNFNIRYVQNNINDNLLLISEDDRSTFIEKINNDYFSEIQTYKIIKQHNSIDIINYKDNYWLDNDYLKFSFNNPQNQYISSLTSRNNDSVQFHYNQNNELDSIFFTNNQLISLNYYNNKLTYLNIPKYQFEISFNYSNDNLNSVNYNDNRIHYYYNHKCKLLSQIVYNNQIVFIEYNDDMQVKRVYKPNSELDYTFKYDTVEKTTKFIRDKNVSYLFKYDSTYNTIEILKNNSLQTIKKWDEFGNLIFYQDLANNNFHYKYNDLGLISEIIDPQGNKSYFAYNDLGRLIRKISPNGDIIDYKLDIYGNINSIQINNNFLFEKNYNQFGFPISINTLNENYQISYDSLNRFSKLMVGNFNNYYFDFNSHNHLMQISDSNFFRINSIINKNESIIDIRNYYDRVTKKLYLNNNCLLDSMNLNNVLFLRYYYDKLFRLIKYNYGNSEISLNYQNIYNCNIQSFSNNFSINFDPLYTIKNIINGDNTLYYYNDLGQLIQVDYNKKSYLKLYYNFYNKVNKIILPNNQIINIVYNNIGLIKNIFLPDNIYKQFKYDYANRLIEYKENDRIYKFDYLDMNNTNIVLPNNHIYSYSLKDKIYSIHSLNYHIRYELDSYFRISKIYNNNFLIRSNYYSGNFLYKENFFDKLINEYIYNDNGQLTHFIQNQDTLTRLNYSDLTLNSFGKNNINLIFIFDFDLNLTRIFNFNKFSFDISSSKNSLNLFWSGNQYIYNYNYSKLTNITNPISNNLTINYNNNYSIESLIDPEDVNAKFQTNSFNKINKLSDKQYSTIFNYNNYNNLSYIINRNGHSRSFQYNNNNLVTKLIDFDENEYNISYINDLIIKKIVFPDGDSLSYEYNSNNQLILFKNFNNSITRYQWNENNQISRISNLYDTIDYYYNNSFLLANLIFNNNNSVQYKYNNYNLLENILYKNLKFEIKYNENNNLSRLLLNDSIILTNNYNENNLLQSQTYFSKNKQYQYNSLEQITELINDNLKKINYYDKLGRLIQTQNNNKTVTYEFDLSSNIIKNIDLKGNTIDFKYDGNRNKILITKNFIDSIKIEYNKNNSPIKYYFQNILSKSIFYNKKNKINIIKDNFDNEISVIYPNIINKKFTIKYKNLINDIEFDEQNRLLGDSYNTYEYSHLGVFSKVNSYDYVLDDSFRTTKIDDFFINSISYNNNLFNSIKLNLNNLNQYDIKFKSKLELTSISNDQITLNIINNENLKGINSYNTNLVRLFIKNDTTQLLKYSMLDTIFIHSNSNLQFGFKDNLFTLESFNNINIKNIFYNKTLLTNLNYDIDNNLIFTEDAIGNINEYIFTKKNLVNHLFADSKYIIKDYDSTNYLRRTYSNTKLNDSISIDYLSSNLSSKHYKYLTNKFTNLDFTNNSFIFSNNIHNIKIFDYLLNNQNHYLYLNNLNLKIPAFENDTLIALNDLIILNYREKNEIYTKIFYRDSLIKKIKEVVNYKDIINNMYYNDTLVQSISIDALNRISQIDSKKLTYNNNNELINLQRTNSELNYKYKNNYLIDSINDYKLTINSLQNITKIQHNDYEKIFFYDHLNRLFSIIDTNQKTEIYYNSLGELAAIYSVDTTYLYYYNYDSLQFNFVENTRSNQVEVYIFNNKQNNSPIIRYNLSTNIFKTIIRNATGIPIFSINSDNKITFSNIDIFGYDSTNTQDDFYSFRDFVYIPSIGLYYNKGSYFDPNLNITINHNIPNKIESIKDITFDNPMKIRKDNRLNKEHFVLEKDDLILEINPFDNEFIDIQNKNKQKYLANELNQLYNNFQPFKISPVLNQPNRFDFISINPIRQFYPSIENILSDFEPDLELVPILPDILIDTLIAQNLKSIKIYNPKISISTNNQLQLIFDILDLAEVDTNFNLVKSLMEIKETECYNQIPTLPDNILDINIYQVNVEDINKELDKNNRIRQIINKNLSSNKNKPNLMDNIYNSIKFEMPQKTRNFKNFYLESTILDFNLNIFEQFLPVDKNRIDNIVKNNMNRLYRFIFQSYKTNSNISTLLYDSPNILLPIQYNTKDNIQHYNLLKEYENIK